MKIGFRSAILTGIVLVASMGGGLAFWMIEDAQTARHRYHQLLQMANPMNVKHESTEYIAKQHREGVQKSFYFLIPKEESLHELRIFADSSELVLSRGEDSEVSEKLEDFRAMIQESLYYTASDGKKSFEMSEGVIPMQNITYMVSDTADCCYMRGTLEAHKAEMTRFVLPGHFLINDLLAANLTPYQSASAEKMLFRYKEGLLLLDGHVSLDHHEGKDLLQLTCDAARLYEEDKMPTVEAQSHVKVVYNNSLTATGDSARFAKGEVVLTGKDKDNRCLLYSTTGDQVLSDCIRLSLGSRMVQMTHPLGILYPVKGEGLPLKFSAQRLLWHHERNQLVLQKDVVISHPTLGRMTNKQEVQIFRAQDKETTLEKIASEGHTVLTRHEPQTQRFYTLTCDGTVLLDHLQGKVLLAAADPMHVPVHLSDELGEIYAHKAQIYYSPVLSRQNAPQKIVLQGNVRITNRNAPVEEDASVVQMALADKVEFNPATNEMVFYANKGKRVLFYEKSNELQISAPKLTVRRDRKTHKESFAGDGDVRFSFQDKEIAQLREKFALPFLNHKEDKK